jgi:hypothetical protein
MGGHETVAWFRMGTANGSRGRKGAAAVAGKTPAGSPSKVKAAAPVTNGTRKAAGVVEAKEATGRAASVPAKDGVGKAAVAAGLQPDRSPPALPIPIASFTF